MEPGPAREPLALPRLPVRASIYLLPDGTVQFGALFAELLPVARSLGVLPADPTPAPEEPAERR